MGQPIGWLTHYLGEAKLVVRHVALVKWKKTATAEQIRVAQNAFPGFVPHMPGFIRFHVSPNIDLDSGADSTWDFGYITDFEDAESFKAYQAHPMHTEYGIKYVHAAREDSRRVQFNCFPATKIEGGWVFRRISLLKWKAGTNAGQIETASKELTALYGRVPGIVEHAIGPNLGIDMRPDLNWDFAITTDFDNLESFRAYRTSDDHVGTGRRFVAPILDSVRSALCVWPRPV